MRWPLPAGMANVTVPHATDGTNVILCHSGWGDGFYPVIGGYDAAGNLVAAHIDLLVHTGLAGTENEQ